MLSYGRSKYTAYINLNSTNNKNYSEKKENSIGFNRGLGSPNNLIRHNSTIKNKKDEGIKLAGNNNKLDPSLSGNTSTTNATANVDDEKDYFTKNTNAKDNNIFADKTPEKLKDTKIEKT